MKILFCVSTELEQQPLLNELIQGHEKKDNKNFTGQHEVDFCVTGLGSVATVYTLLSLRNVKDYDLLIQGGIAGSFNPDFPIGSVVEVVSDRFADLGIEEQNGIFTDVYKVGLIPPDEFPFQSGALWNPKKYTRLPSAHGITVNTVHGEKNAIENIKKLYNPGIESMEGAGFFYVAIRLGIPFCQIRAISNFVEPRDKTNWEISLALANLSKEVNYLMQQGW